MYKRSSWIALSVAAVLTLSGCAGNVDVPEITASTPEKIYQQAQESIELGNTFKAIQALELLESRYPFGPQAIQVQLDLVYAYYKQTNSEKALASIDRFLRLNPTHPDVDYIYYMRGLVNMQADTNLFHSMLKIDRSDRDPQFAIQAFKDFKKLLKDHPESDYAADARQRMIALKLRLASNELKIARYYYDRNIHVAAINRAKHILESYGDTPSTEQALMIMIGSYRALEQEQLAKQSLEVLRHNFPDNALVN